jgi:hypothetical protein
MIPPETWGTASSQTTSAVVVLLVGQPRLYCYWVPWLVFRTCLGSALKTVTICRYCLILIQPPWISTSPKRLPLALIMWTLYGVLKKISDNPVTFETIPLSVLPNPTDFKFCMKKHQMNLCVRAFAHARAFLSTMPWRHMGKWRYSSIYS